MTDTIEFYLLGSPTPMFSIRSSFAPSEGEYVNIKGATYVVRGRSYTVDNSDQVERSIRCNVILRPTL